MTGQPAELKRAVGADVIQLATGAAERLRAVLESLPWVQRLVIPHPGEATVYVRDAASAIPAILRLAAEAGVELDRVTYNQPTLDDVFLMHTGHELKDEEPAA